MLLAEDLTQLDEVLLILFNAGLQKYVLIWHVWVLFIDDHHGLLADFKDLILLYHVVLILFAVMIGTLYNS